MSWRGSSCASSIMPLSETAWRVYKVIFWRDCTQRLQNTYCKGADDFWFWESKFPTFINALLTVERKQDKKTNSNETNLSDEKRRIHTCTPALRLPKGLERIFVFFAPLLVRVPGTAVACDEMRLSVEFVTVGFLGIWRQYCCDWFPVSWRANELRLKGALR